MWSDVVNCHGNTKADKSSGNLGKEGDSMAEDEVKHYFDLNAFAVWSNPVWGNGT